MVVCSIKGCKNKTENCVGKKVSFFSFPKNPEMAAKWTVLCKREVNLKSARVCSVHFLPSCFKPKPAYYGDYSPKRLRTLLPDAVPTENLFDEQRIIQDIDGNTQNDRNISINSRVNSLLGIPVLMLVNPVVNSVGYAPDEHEQKSVIVDECINRRNVFDLLEIASSSENVATIARVCSIHFTKNCFERKPEHLIVPGDTNIYKLSKVAVPTLHLHVDCDNSRSKIISCVVYGCSNDSTKSDSSIKYYPFPKNEFGEQWAAAAGWESNTFDLETAHMCSTHFEESAYESEREMSNSVACNSRTLKSDAIPTLCLPQTQIRIRGNTLEIEDGVVIYEINSSDFNDGITMITFGHDSTLEHDIKVETIPSTLKTEINERNEKYNSIKSHQNLVVLQAQNERLKRKLAPLEQEVEELRKSLAEKQSEYSKYENKCKYLERKVETTTFNQEEQKSLLSKVFSEAQIKILFGKKRVYWSNDDMSVGYIIRHLSNKRCYNYLTQKLNIPLPGLSSIKRWITANKTKKIRR